jgi:hypothetical protein
MEGKMPRYVRKTRLGQATAICVAAVFLIAAGSDALSQQPSPKTRTSLLCKISLTGGGVLVTLSNLTASTIPEGQTLFARKGNKTLQFRATKAIPNGGSVENRTSAKEFVTEGDCEGW